MDSGVIIPGMMLALLAAAACSGMLGMTVDELRECVRLRVNPKFLDMNLRAIEEAEKRFGK